MKDDPNVRGPKLTAPVICTIRPHRVRVRRSAAFQLFDTALGVVTLLPGDYVIEFPTGEVFVLAGKDAGVLYPTDSAAAGLLAAPPVSLAEGELPWQTLQTLAGAQTAYVPVEQAA